MTIQSKFPEALLLQPVEVKKTYFKNIMVIHPHFIETYHELRRTIREAVGVRLILVLGCPGVGTTMLQAYFENKLIEEELPGLEGRPGRVPVFTIEAVAEGLRHFNWNDFYIRSLQGLQEPLINDKGFYDDDLRQGGQEWPATPEVTSEDILRQALEQCLYYRQLTAFCIDEAEHFLRGMNQDQITGQRQKLLSLARGTAWVLFGNYELRHLIDSSSLFRVIHFRRYNAERREDIQIFKGILLTLQSHLPLHKLPDLLRDWEYLYEGSLGCVGILKDWLTRALYRALKDDQRGLSRKYLEQSAIPPARLYRMAQKILADEVIVEKLSR